MSCAVVITSEMDHLDQLGAKAFAGFLVRKDLVRKYSRQYPVPTYVVEFLLGRYCASTDPTKGARCALQKRSYSRPAPVIKAASRSSTSCGPG
jgi:predicted ATP-dependent Lon-type protease